MDTKIELMETRFLKENGGYLTMENVVEIGKLKRLGKERFNAIKTTPTAYKTAIINENTIRRSVALVNEVQVQELERTVYEAPAGMTGEDMRNELLTYKLNNVENLNYFEMKKLAAELGLIQSTDAIKKEALIELLKDKKELALKEQERQQEERKTKTARIEPEGGWFKDYQVGQEAIYTTMKGENVEVRIAKVCKNGARIEFADGRIQLAYFGSLRVK